MIAFANSWTWKAHFCQTRGTARREINNQLDIWTLSRRKCAQLTRARSLKISSPCRHRDASHEPRPWRKRVEPEWEARAQRITNATYLSVEEPGVFKLLKARSHLFLMLMVLVVELFLSRCEPRPFSPNISRSFSKYNSSWRRRRKKEKV